MSELGIISQSAEAYHAADGVSNSKLKWITPPRTPMHYRARWIDKEIKEEETPALRLGSLAHRCILEPHTMAGAFHVRPEGMKFTTRDGMAWRDSHADREILSAPEAADIQGMSRSVWAHPTASRILKGADCERSAFVEEKGMLLKARFDCLPKTGNVIADLKTIEFGADLDSIERAMAKYLYFAQAALYLKVANLLGLKRDMFVFIFVEKNPPYAVACYTLIDTVLDVGRMMVERNLQTLRNCIAENSWPGYQSGVNPCGLPQFAMKQLEQLSS